MDVTALRQPYILARRGQAFGLTSLLFMVALAVYLAYLHQPGWAVAIGALDFAAVVAVFVAGRSVDDERKAPRSQRAFERRAARAKRQLELEKLRQQNEFELARQAQDHERKLKERVRPSGTNVPEVTSKPNSFDQWADPLPGVASAHPEYISLASGTSVAPFYVVIDESFADSVYFEVLNNRLGELPITLARDPEIMKSIRLGIIGYANDAVIRMPLTSVASDSFIPQLIPRTGNNLYEVFDQLHNRIRDDVNRLKARDMAVRRPTVHLLAATRSAEQLDWEKKLQEILNREDFPYAPNIIACGVSSQSYEVLRTIAAQRGGYGFVVDDPEMSLDNTIQNYLSWLGDMITTFVRTSIGGMSEVELTPPEGFQMIGPATS